MVDMGVFINGGAPKWMVYQGTSPSNMDDEQGYPYFRKPPYKWLNYGLWYNYDITMVDLTRGKQIILTQNSYDICHEIYPNIIFNISWPMLLGYISWS